MPAFRLVFSLMLPGRYSLYRDITQNGTTASALISGEMGRTAVDKQVFKDGAKALLIIRGEQGCEVSQILSIVLEDHQAPELALSTLKWD